VNHQHISIIDDINSMSMIKNIATIADTINLKHESIDGISAHKE
jgi:hypothetical protein